MKKALLVYSWLFPVIFLTSCTQIDFPYTSKSTQACDIGPVRLMADFESSRMDECINKGNDHFVITLKPENTPINPSPWYAFKVIADQPKKVHVTIKVAGNRANRYLPKISSNLKSWRLHEHQIHGKNLELSINTSQSPQYVAGQEIINNQYYTDWATHLKTVRSINYGKLGESKQGRPIYKLESRAQSHQWLVILGRLHPPEVTGALALFPFVETLLAENELSKTFRQKYNILVIPNLNPDGVAMGNWRHNANGVDLNRDWNKLEQPETRQVHQYLQHLMANGEQIKFAIDFHSTQHDIFYTMPVNYDVENRYFVKHWLDALDESMPDFSVVQQPGNNPNIGVSKQYFADQYKVHGITYEMGDETDRDKIKTIAHNAAILLMETMLSNTDHNKE